MMQIESQTSGRSLEIRGKITFSCGDDSFSVDFQDKGTLVEFPSLSRLLKVKSQLDSLRGSMSRLPSLPQSRVTAGKNPLSRVGFNLPEFRLIVRGRPIGKLEFGGGGVHFHLTPFAFITKRMPPW